MCIPCAVVLKFKKIDLLRPTEPRFLSCIEQDYLIPNQEGCKSRWILFGLSFHLDLPSPISHIAPHRFEVLRVQSYEIVLLPCYLYHLTPHLEAGLFFSIHRQWLLHEA